MENKMSNADNMIGKFVGLKIKNYAFSYANELLKMISQN